MGILTPISGDVEQLIQAGYDDFYISKSVGIDISVIEYIIKYFRKQHNKQPSINIKPVYKKGERYDNNRN